MKMKLRIFKEQVAKNDPKKLGHFLYKRGFSKRAIKNAQHHGGMIFVNHKRRNSAFHLQAGDEVLFVMGREKKNMWLKPSHGCLHIEAETKNWIVLNKPAGVLSIPSRYEDSDAIVNRLLGYFASRGEAEEMVKPHVITRLDRDTSGLLLAAKNSVAAARLSSINKNLFVKKYHAIVHGNFTSEQNEGMITLPIGKVGDSVKRGVTATGQKAITRYRVLTQVPGASLVEIRLLTGRTHQIRVHFSHIGHPLYGDDLYGVADNFARQALNCCSLSFPWADKVEQFVISDPADMRKLWFHLTNK